MTRKLPTMAEIERGVILNRLAKMQWHRARTAKSLGIGKRTLGLKIHLYRSEGIFIPTVGASQWPLSDSS